MIARSREVGTYGPLTLLPHKTRVRHNEQAQVHNIQQNEFKEIQAHPESLLRGSFLYSNFRWYIAALPSMVVPVEQTPPHSTENEDDESESSLADSEHSTASLMDSEIDVTYETLPRRAG